MSPQPEAPVPLLLEIVSKAAEVKSMTTSLADGLEVARMDQTELAAMFAVVLGLVNGLASQTEALAKILLFKEA